jgi:hypothetical protein
VRKSAHAAGAVLLNLGETLLEQRQRSGNLLVGGDWVAGELPTSLFGVVAMLRSQKITSWRSWKALIQD